MLKGKTIIVGISGGIAVYKVCDVISRLKKLNANVHVIMTKSAEEFVNPLTFQTLSNNRVVSDMFEKVDRWDVEHISLAQAADLFLIAPATANIIGKIANGIADDMLSTTAMATKASVLIAPAMNTNMYTNKIVQGNIECLKSLGYDFIQPELGMLACGDIGIGKLAQPEIIVKHVVDKLTRNKDLNNKKILITAGPTIEPIDPVRYMTNRSTGKMGYALAKAAVERGAKVTLISGPVSLKQPTGLTKYISIKTANEMYQAVLNEFEENEVIIKTAAVADYRPAMVSDKKIKKSDDDLTITLERNPDISKEIGKKKGNRILVGFAAETDNMVKNATNKIKSKNFDFIVLNDVTKSGAGFGSETNIITIIDKDNNIVEYPKMDKLEVANIILNTIKTKM